MFVLQVNALFCILQVANMEVYYVAEADNITHKQTCYHKGEEFHPCFTLQNLSGYFPLQNVTNLTVYLLSEYILVNENLNITFMSHHVVYLQSWYESRTIVHCFGDFSLQFINVSIIKLEFLTFHSCGKYSPVISLSYKYYGVITETITYSSIELINSSNSLVQSTGRAYSLIVNNSLFECNSIDFAIKVKYLEVAKFTNTSFINNFGGAISSAAVSYIFIENCNFVNNSVACLETNKRKYIMHKIVVSGSNFSDNFGDDAILTVGDVRKFLVINSRFGNNRANSKGGAIAIKPEIETWTPRHLNVTDCLFLNNSAKFGGSIYSKSIRQGEIHLYIERNLFVLNYAERGGAIYVDHETPINSLSYKTNIKIISTYFSLNNATYIDEEECPEDKEDKSIGGAIAVQTDSYYSILVENSTFVGNDACIGGALSFMTTTSNLGSLKVIHSSFTHNKAKQFGGGLSLHKANSLIIGSTFIMNSATVGGGIYCTSSFVNITRLYLRKNKAVKSGGGISLFQTYFFISEKNYFDNNRATTGNGGAIYVQDNEEDCDVGICKISWKVGSIIEFVNNSALNGSVLYGGMLDRCYHENQQNLGSFIEFLQLHHNSTSVDIWSEVVKFCFCDSEFKVCCETRSIRMTVYPGQSFNVPVACLNQVEKPLECDINSDYYGTTKISLGEGESSRTVYNYTILSFHAYSSEQKFGTLILTAKILCNKPVWNKLEVLIHIEEMCPLGFGKKVDRCLCDRRLQKVFPTISCNISNNSLSIRESGWFGYDDHYLRMHKRDCPLNYCSQKEVTMCPTCSDVRCDNNHEGILCGKCTANHSVAIGSSICIKCLPSNRFNFIWLTLLMGLAGIALVFFLYLVKITISSGTTNGLIFYANIISFSGLLDTMSCNAYSDIPRVFLSWINLDLGIEVCFYPGMDIYQKTWLQFVFPLYIWFLVGVIALLCHYSTTVTKIMGLRNIEVLATLFLLSYAKLLKTIVTALSYTDLQIASSGNISEVPTTERVWVYDGSIKYLSGQHVPLFVVAMLFLVLLFLPYTMLLLFGQHLRSVRPVKGFQQSHNVAVIFLDAYHAPYSNNHRYWTGLYLMIRCCLFTVFGTTYSIYKNLFWISLSVILILTFRLSFPGIVYQNKMAGLLELFYLANLGAISVSLQYFHNFCTSLTVSATLSLLVFLITLAYHVGLQIRDKCPVGDHILKRLPLKSSNVPKPDVTRLHNNEIRDKSPDPSITYTELREPLIN